jgi:segregation and condensation protein B
MSDLNDLARRIEALLFWKGEPIKKSKLASFLGVDEVKVDKAISLLDEMLKDRGVVIIRQSDEVAMGTAPQLSTLINRVAKEELTRDIGKAGLETLAIILYKGPVSRREIDWIRGVNSTFILRNLMIRGLIEREANEKDQRSFLYRPTLELLGLLGLKKIEDLPEWSTVREEMRVNMSESENVAKTEETDNIATSNKSANDSATISLSQINR